MLLLYVITFKNTEIILLKYYAVIQSIIYLLPFYLLILFNIHHNNYDNSIYDHYKVSLFYIFIFDIILISTFLSLYKSYPIKLLKHDYK